MSLDSATTTQPVRVRCGNTCAQCGDTLLAPDRSEHVNERYVHHLWTCERCGYQFETIVYLRSR
jgi:uncharacterized protein with PIN domain